jgi:hypothetical protein
MSAKSDFGTFGRYKELSLEEMTAEQRKAYDFTMRQRGQVSWPDKIWLQNPKLIEVMVPLDAYPQGHSSLSKAEIEIATNLTNGRWTSGYSNYRDAGLTDLTVLSLGTSPACRSVLLLMTFQRAPLAYNAKQETPQ